MLVRTTCVIRGSFKEIQTFRVTWRRIFSSTSVKTRKASHEEKPKRPKQGKENSKNMNKPNIKQQLRRGFFALAIVGALLTLPKAQAQPVPAIFYSTDCEHVISVQTVGQNTIVTLAETVCLHDGTFEGGGVGTERDVIHPNGTVTIQSSGVFSGTVNGRSGTCVISAAVNVDVTNH